MGSLTARSGRGGLRLALAALMAVFALLAVPHPARATEIWAETWRDVHDAIALAETTDEQVYIRISRQFDRWEGDPDLVMHGGDVVINMDAFRINPRVAGQSVESGRIITLEGGRLTLQGLDQWSNGGFTGGSAELGGAILMTGGELCMQGGLIKGNDAQYGAGIAVMGGTCTIEGGTITGGIATQGGGVYVGPGGSLSVVGGTLSSNNADFGAGIYNAGGEVTLSGGVVSDNSASNDGGGVYVDGGDASLADGAVLEKNRAAKSGGNLALGGDPNGVVFMDGGVIREGSAAQGGGVAAIAGKFLFFGGEIVANSAACGAGVATLGGSIFIEGGSVHGNTGSFKGGGAYVRTGTLCVWSGSVEANRAEAVDDEWGETTTAEGGGIYVAADGRLEVKGSPAIASNTRGDNPQDVFLEGDAIINVTDSFTPASAVGVDLHDLPELGQTRAIAALGKYGSEAFSCQAPDCEYVYEAAGGGQGTALLRRVREHEGTRVSSWADLSQRLRALARDEEASFWLDGDLTYGTGLPEAYATRPLEVRRNAHVTIDLNGYAINRNLSHESQPSSEDSERCLYVSLGTLVIRDGRGGGRVCGGCCQRGAGVFLAEGTLILEGGLITDNKATYGGGVYVGMGTFELRNGRIYDNEGLATSLPCGGGVYVGDNSSLPQLETGGEGDEGSSQNEVPRASMTMTGGSIDTNKAAGWGAGVCISNGSFTMTDGTIDANTRMDGASQGGGGIYACGGSTVAVSGGAITNNQLTNKEGAGISIAEGSSAVLTGTTISKNYANRDGGGVCAEASDLVIDGAVINQNTTRGSGGGVVIRRGGTCRFNVGSINDNRANGCGAGMQVNLGGSCTMTGGEMTGNLAWSGNATDGDGTVGNDPQDGDDESLGAEYSMGGAINVQGELVISSGTITGNGAVIGSGICFDCERWQTEKGRLAVSGSPLITENYLSWAARNKEDITIYMGHDADESARISVEGSFTPIKPPLVEKIYRGGWEYVALVDPGDYEMDAFACGQDRVNGNTDYVLVKRDDVLYAYLHTHSWETHTDERYPNRVTLTCTHTSCPNYLHEAVLRLEIEGLWDRQTELVYDGVAHAAYMGKVDVPLDLRYDVAYSYYEGTSVSGNPLKEPPSEIGTYTAEARLEVAGSTVYLTRTFSIRSVNNEMDANQMGHDETTEPPVGGGASAQASNASAQTSDASVGTSKRSAAQRLPHTSDVPLVGVPALVLSGTFALLIGIRQRHPHKH